MPEGFKPISKIKEQVARLEAAINPREPSDMDFLKAPENDPKFAFYEKLSSKKQETVKKGRPVPTESNTSMNSSEEPEVSKTVGLFTVQLASLDNEVRAIRLVTRLTDRGYSAYYYETEIEGRTYYRVRCGRFNQREEADEYRDLLAEEEGVRGFVSEVTE
jgi:cell division septation protein DedD